MKTLEFLSQNLNSPIISHRDRAMLTLFKLAIKEQQVIEQLGLNLSSKNLDLVWGSLKILLAVSFVAPEKIKSINDKIFRAGKNADHFGITCLSGNILNNTDMEKGYANLISKKIKPKIIKIENEKMFFDNCDYSLEYSIGKEYKYELSHICRMFRYDCKKASKQVFLYMKKLGYRTNVQYWKEKPAGWNRDFENRQYETSLHHYARNAIQMFLMWCVNNLSIERGKWDELLDYEDKWNMSISSLLIKAKPDFIKFEDVQVDVNKWIRKRINKSDAYALFNFRSGWIPLYENTNFRTDEKSFNRYVITCFIRKPIGRISKKIEFSPIHYKYGPANLNEFPIRDMVEEKLFLDGNSQNKFSEGKTVPSYGIVNDDVGDYVKLFPAPEIISHLKLTQGKNNLEYFKGNELVAHCINWKGGYHKNIDTYGEDRFELSNYGSLLMIKAKYLRRYMKENDFKLMAVGHISKRKIDKWSERYESKSSKYKWLPFEVIKDN